MVTETFFLQSLVCLLTHTAAGVEVMISNGAVCLSRLVSINLQLDFQIKKNEWSIYEIMLNGFLTFQPTESPTCL